MMADPYDKLHRSVAVAATDIYGLKLRDHPDAWITSPQFQAALQVYCSALNAEIAAPVPEGHPNPLSSHTYAAQAAERFCDGMMEVCQAALRQKNPERTVETMNQTIHNWITVRNMFITMQDDEAFS